MYAVFQPVGNMCAQIITYFVQWLMQLLEDKGCLDREEKKEFADIDAFMEQFRWERRLLVVAAPCILDHQYIDQMEDIRRNKAGLALRHISVLVLVHDDQENSIMMKLIYDKETGDVQKTPYEHMELPDEFVRQLTSLYQIKNNFEVVLVGKDGGVKKKFYHTVSAVSIFEIIDAMPMRKREISEQRDLEAKAAELQRQRDLERSNQKAKVAIAKKSQEEEEEIISRERDAADALKENDEKPPPKKKGLFRKGNKKDKEGNSESKENIELGDVQLSQKELDKLEKERQKEEKKREKEEKRREKEEKKKSKGKDKGKESPKDGAPNSIEDEAPVERGL